MKYFFTAVITFLLLGLTSLSAQKAQVKEEFRMLTTYPFDDPDPVPIIVSNPKIYPYYKYEGYTHNSQPQSWKVVKLENDFIEVYVLPEVGGKVWGAIDKTTGKEFIYRNEVMKFRNISMRGPWTSGGIEFNFGIIGHHPSTATPVDYVIEEHDDGSVSCTVGNIDLSSRTHWRVTISLAQEEAFFRTKAVWYNPTEETQSYYNWMTAAAFAQEDLVFYTPGDQYLKHSGEAVDWPLDIRQRDLARYGDNNFGPSKSYHVVGEYNNFFGGYFEQEDYGFGHVSNYDEMPGQKLWLWALSRSGGIWEDLLTDADGQYIEFQAGRLFVQYSPATHQNPVTNVGFEPLTTDAWEEYWFPVNKIGGISDASEYGVMYVDSETGRVQLNIMGLQKVESSIRVVQKGNTISEELVQLDPLQVWSKEIKVNTQVDFEIFLDGMDLYYSSNPDTLQLKRPFVSPDQMDAEAHSLLVRSAREDIAYREYDKAKLKLRTVLQEDPHNLSALVELGMLYYRSGEYKKGLKLGLIAQSLDTYNPDANFLCGNLHWAQQDAVNALESYGWAARSMLYRSSAYARMAQIYLSQKKWSKAKDYASRSLTYNAENIPALQMQLLIAKQLNDRKLYTASYEQIIKLDPLNHLAKLESGQMGQGLEMKNLSTSHQSELAYQTYLELALTYYNYGLNSKAHTILNNAPSNWLIRLWTDYLDNGQLEELDKIASLPTKTVFPFRKETIGLLNLAEASSDHWVFKYWKGLLLKGLGRHDEASELFLKCEQNPDDPYFYVARAQINSDNTNEDLLRAYQLEPTSWRTAHALMTNYLKLGKAKKALQIVQEILKHHPSNYVLEMDQIKSLHQLNQLEEANEMLAKIQVLPFEGASEGRSIYAAVKRKLALTTFNKEEHKQALEYLAQSRVWPENLGVGKPYKPDERFEDYLTGLILKEQGKSTESQKHFKKVVDYTKTHIGRPSMANVLGILLLIQQGEDDEAFALLGTSISLNGFESDYSTKMKQLIKKPYPDGVEILRKLIE